MPPVWLLMWAPRLVFRLRYNSGMANLPYFYRYGFSWLILVFFRNLGTLLSMLEVGDVVYLKSNPEVLMTVSFVIKENELTGFASNVIKKQMRRIGFTDGDVQCRWFIDSECQADFFKAAMLRKKAEK